MPTDKQKTYLDRANRAHRALLKEKKEHGYISDGAGKRYLVCVYYVLGGAPEEAAEFIEWFEDEFSDDIGEPAFNLFAALAYHRTANTKKARQYLLDTMLSNIYLLPFLYAEPLEKQDMWHFSNRDEPDYLREIEEFLEEPTDEERVWFKAEFTSELFTKIRDRYVQTFHALQHTDDVKRRGRILDEWYRHASSVRTDET